ncbi:Tetratricopeptide repeat-containing protein [Jannaschia rubra]|nr:Tetratricopeptide repeat-containing protein [Jannaschia rubra]
MPGATDLAKALATKFLTPKTAKDGLMVVAELAASEAGSSAVNQWLADTFEAFEPTDAHLKLPTFRWKAIATTNYDVLVEKAYDRSEPGAQTLVTRYKDDQAFGSMMDAQESPLPFLKLHGCARHAHDAQVPLILTPSSYNNHEANRGRLYRQLEDLAADYTVIYCGQSLSDLHIRRLSQEGNRSARPFHFLVVPDLDDVKRRFWADHRVEGVRATFADFVNALDTTLPPLMRLPRPPASNEDKPYRTFFAVNQDESDRLATAFRTDLQLVHSGLPVGAAEAQRFYSGHNEGWGAIRRGFDVQRRVSRHLLEFIAEAPLSGPQLAVVRGAAGFGKSIALRRAAWELGVSLGELVVWANDDARVWPDVLQELHELTGRRIHLFIDRAAYNLEKVEAALAAAQAKDVPVTVVTAERTNEWSIYCQRLEKYAPEFFDATKLSKREVDELLEKLEEHRCLGKLGEETPARRKEIITGKLDRQLLVVLHEVTRGVPFETIIKDEFERIAPPEAQTLYLDICTLNRFDVPVRAGIVSRLSGISFRDFETEFFEPLEDLVEVGQNVVSGDYEYRARHAHVGEIVFTQVCQTDEQRHDQIVRVLSSLDRSFQSDNLALSGLLRGRYVADTFENIGFARDVYDLALHRNPQAAFIGQQRAIFEMQHADGEGDAAQAAIDAALEIEPHNSTLHHTRSRVLAYRAKSAPSEFARGSLRSQARSALGNIPNQSDVYVLTAKARLRVDDVEDAFTRMDASPSDARRDELAEAVDDAERAIARAMNVFPEEPELLRSEARLQDLLGDGEAAIQLLEKAWAKMPRGAGVAKQLARRYLARNDVDAALATLNVALERQPTDRSLNLMIANILFSEVGDINDSKAVDFLKASFVSGDREHWGRFVRAGHAYVTGDYGEAERLFDDLNQRAPDDFRPKLRPAHRWLLNASKDRRGVIAKNFGAYFLITPTVGPDGLYTPSWATDDEDWESLGVRSQVRFDIGFNRRGPFGRNVRSTAQ